MTLARERRAPWLALATLLHGALWWGVSVRSSAPNEPAGAAPLEFAAEIELATEGFAASADALPDAAAQSVVESKREPATLDQLAAERSRATSHERRAALVEATGEGAAEPPAGAADSEASPLTAGAGERESSPNSAQLSPDALGIGSNNPFVANVETRPEAAPRGSRRAAGTSQFQRSLAGEIVRADQSRGLGPEGPVLSSLENIVRRGDAALNSKARFRFTTDAEGRLVGAELLSSSSDPAPFRRHAESVLEALRSQKLRIPKTGRGVTFVVRVESRVQMPSGADPGLAVNILGVPIQKGEGPRSARIAILDVTPKLEVKEERLPSGQTVSVPSLSVGNVLSMMGDLSDIGAKPQRMVHAHVERIGASDVVD